jgi:hypothetical protein
VNDESGMTMALAIIMIVLIGVMGAGLLTFVSRDLNTVIEENRGQRAFEVADAGIGAAKRQLASNVVREQYDGLNGLTDIPDIQWSFAQGGLTLNNLDGDGATSDSVNVTIKYCAAPSTDPQCAAAGSSAEYFRVISTGTYGDAPQQAKRKIEAIFKGISSGCTGCGIVGHPLYFTPGSISIDGPEVNLNSISMFAGGDIIIEEKDMNGDSVLDSADFVSDYESAANGQTFKGFSGKDDELCDWNSYTPSNPTKCFVNATGPYNKTPRTIMKNGSPVAYEKPGIAAEGKICGFPDNSTSLATPPGTCGTSASIADGVYAYDMTTGTKGNHLKFEKICNPTCPASASGKISYPFPTITPVPLTLYQDAACQNRAYAGNAPDWDYLFRPLNQGVCGNQTEKIVFVDAGNDTLHLQTDNDAKNTGLLVVWCGRLEMDQKFRGIILSLYGNGSGFASSCDNTLSGQQDVGTYRNNGRQCQCWTYAQGGTATRAGIEIGPSSQIDFYQADWSFLNNEFTGPPATSFAIESWRELYQ